MGNQITPETLAHIQKLARPTPLERELERRAEEMGRTLKQYIEEMCAAWYAKTNIPPEDAVIVYEQKAGGYIIYIRRREKRDGA